MSGVTLSKSMFWNKFENMVESRLFENMLYATYPILTFTNRKSNT